MPLYMDIHSVPGVKAVDVAKAHLQDLVYQKDFGCNCMTYWVDESRENIFCLIEAESADAVNEMHRKAHGLIPHKIIEVNSSVVHSFLGRIYDPEHITLNNGLKIFAESGYRFLVITQPDDHILLRHSLGVDAANEIIRTHNSSIREIKTKYNGSEVEHAGDGFIFSFASATQAVQCALAVHDHLSDNNNELTTTRVAVHGGEPVEQSSQIFGDVITFANNLCSLKGNAGVSVSSRVKDIASKEVIDDNRHKLCLLSKTDEEVVFKLFKALEENYINSDFGIPELSELMAMSQPQLYRRTVSLTDLSPNALLKEYRLEKAKELLRKETQSVAQITFGTGFTSPSYFTKCFKARYGLLPVEYLQLMR